MLMNISNPKDVGENVDSYHSCNRQIAFTASLVFFSGRSDNDCYYIILLRCMFCPQQELQSVCYIKMAALVTQYLNSWFCWLLACKMLSTRPESPRR